MINAGETTVHFTKLKATQMAEMRSVLQKRPKAKFSVGLSPEAQEAMQQVQEETKIQQAAKRGKRGSKGNVLFSETVHVRQELASPTRGGRRPSYSDVFESARLDEVYSGYNNSKSPVGPEPPSPRRSVHGRRRGSVTQWLSERPDTVSELDEVDQVLSANMAPAVSPSLGL